MNTKTLVNFKLKHKLVIVIAILFGIQNVSAQLFTKEKLANSVNQIDYKFLSWGYYLGFNSFDFKFNYNEDLRDVLVEDTFGFHLGLIGDMRINDHLNLRFEPGVFFTNRNLQYDESYFTRLGLTFNDADLTREVKSTYIHLPLLLKISTKRINNFKPFIIGGVSTAINLSSNEDNRDDNFSGQFRSTTNNYFYEIGFGIDLYLTYFKFTPSIRGIFAINDELIRDNAVNGASPWTGNIAKMQTRGVFINFTFQ